jgi:hypothetical protein
MKTLASIFIALSFMLVVCTSAFARVDFRCGNTHAEEGKTQSAEILISCGEPKIKEDMGYKGRGVGRKLEKWIYEKGGKYYILYFEGGILQKVEQHR